MKSVSSTHSMNLDFSYSLILPHLKNIYVEEIPNRRTIIEEEVEEDDSEDKIKAFRKIHSSASNQPRITLERLSDLSAKISSKNAEEAKMERIRSKEIEEADGKENAIQEKR